MMRHVFARSRVRWLAATGGICALAVAGVAIAQSASGYDLSWHTFGGGGVSSSSDGVYGMRGVAGQTFIGQSSNGPYAVDSRYIGGGATPKTKRFVPEAAKDD